MNQERFVLCFDAVIRYLEGKTACNDDMVMFSSEVIEAELFFFDMSTDFTPVTDNKADVTWATQPSHVIPFTWYFCVKFIDFFGLLIADAY